MFCFVDCAYFMCGCDSFQIAWLIAAFDIGLDGVL